MEIWFQVQIFLFPLIAFALLYLFKKSQSNNAIEPPQPLGAWPLIGHLHLFRGQVPLAKTMGAMADKYGPIISLRLGLRRVVIISSWELVKECLTLHDKNFANRPVIAAGMHLGYGNAMYAFAPYGEYWREIRKITNQELLFRHQVELLNHVRVPEIKNLIKDLSLLCLKNDNNNPVQVDLSNLVQHMSFNIIFNAIAGKRYDEEKYIAPNSEAWKLERCMKMAAYLTGVFVSSDVFPGVEWMDIGGYLRSMKETAKELDGVFQSWLEQHLIKKTSKNGTYGEDFMDKMLAILGEDVVISGHKRDNIIKATLVILVFAGAESSMLSITWTLSLLLNNPHVFEKAREEIDSQVGRSKWVQESDIKKLTYLQAMTKETFRLYPPAPLTPLREAMEDCHVAGFHIPKHTRLQVNIWKLHRDPRVWPEPNEFRPERFLMNCNNGDVSVKDDQKFGFIPFSYGRRSCPGREFSMPTVHLALASLIQGFDMKTPRGEKVDMREGLGLSLPKLIPLEVAITPRLPLELYKTL